MLYRVFHTLLKFACYLYFSRIRLYQTENISSHNPLIVCANHGNSFMDAILIAITLKRKLHFLARADVFNTPFKRWFLSQINMMPIYRIRDGREELKNNDAIFDKCQRILEKNGAILIFPEGTCIVEKRLRTFKTGFVQLAFEAKVKDLQILPVTLNYSKPLDFYTDVSLDFSKPIDVFEFKNEADNDYIKFSKRLITETLDRISERMIIIPNNEDDEFYEQVLEITRNDYKESFLLDQLKIVKYLNEIKLNNSLLYNNLKEKSQQYFHQLNQHNIMDEAVINKNNYRQNFLFLSYPFYFSGVIIHFIPTTIINYFIEKKVKEIQFKSAVRLVIGLTIYLIYTPILFALASVVLTFGSIFLIGLIYFFYSNFHQLKLIFSLNRVKDLNIDFEMQREELKQLLNP